VRLSRKWKEFQQSANARGDNRSNAYYRLADLFVLRFDREGFGSVIVEALARGLPVVSTDCKCGPSEILEHGRCGRLVRIGDADALASAMLGALSSNHDRELLKAADVAPEVIGDQISAAALAAGG
jgi:glycosyltransferase involved in cell wall biosynthesis